MDPTVNPEQDAKLVDAFSALQKEFGRPPEDEEVLDYLGIPLESYYELLDDAKGVTLLSSEDLRRIIVKNTGSYEIMEELTREIPCRSLPRMSSRKS